MGRNLSLLAVTLIVFTQVASRAESFSMTLKPAEAFSLMTRKSVVNSISGQYRLDGPLVQAADHCAVAVTVTAVEDCISMEGNWPAGEKPKSILCFQNGEIGRNTSLSATPYPVLLTDRPQPVQLARALIKSEGMVEQSRKPVSELMKRLSHKETFFATNGTSFYRDTSVSSKEKSLHINFGGGDNHSAHGTPCHYVRQ